MKTEERVYVYSFGGNLPGFSFHGEFVAKKDYDEAAALLRLARMALPVDSAIIQSIEKILERQ